MIDEQRGAASAEDLLEDLGIDTLPINPASVAQVINDDSFKLVLEAHSFDSTNILGKAVGNTKAAIIYINSNIPNTGRYNFTAAHEIGHVCMHIMPGREQEFQCGNSQLSGSYNDPKEKEANGFASGLLMPRNLLKPLTDGEINWANIHAIANACDTSLEAAFRRMAAIYREDAALLIHKGGVFKRYASSAGFDAFIPKNPLSKDQRTLCSDGLSGDFSSEFEISDASDWVSPRIKGDILRVIHSSSITLSDDFTYTLLKYDDECFSEEEEY